MTRWNDFWMNTRKVKLFSIRGTTKSSSHFIGTSLVNISDLRGNTKHPKQGKPQLITYKRPSKQVKTKTPETSNNPSTILHTSLRLIIRNIFTGSFNALPSVSHFTLRLTKRLARILITAHLGVRLGQFPSKG